jgi:hypothetical protein
MGMHVRLPMTACQAFAAAASGSKVSPTERLLNGTCGDQPPRPQRTGMLDSSDDRSSLQGVKDSRGRASV